MIMSLTFVFCQPRTNLVFEEADGLVAVEAEHYFDQQKTEIRKWHIQTESQDQIGIVVNQKKFT